VIISLEKLTAQAAATGFRPDVLEKVAHLLVLLEALGSHPFLKGKLALKGGTALNLFVFAIPRLSVDIDLNYMGAEDRETMLAERPKIEQAVQAVFARGGFTVRRIPEEHAGGKWSLRYQSAAGQGGNLEVDLNFMFRIPLWPVTIADSHPVGTWQATQIPIIDIHELAAGKLAALLARRQARDLFDSHGILRMENLDQNRLRTAFVVLWSHEPKGLEKGFGRGREFRYDGTDETADPYLACSHIRSSQICRRIRHTPGGRVQASPVCSASFFRSRESIS
jgi:predicted nucleotidyltransferase component of viral defense system